MGIVQNLTAELSFDTESINVSWDGVNPDDFQIGDKIEISAFINNDSQNSVGIFSSPSASGSFETNLFDEIYREIPRLQKNTINFIAEHVDGGVVGEGE